MDSECQWAATGSVLLAPGITSPGSGDAILLPPILPAWVLGRAHTVSPYPKQHHECFREGGQTVVATGAWFLHISEVGSASLSSSWSLG